MILKYIESFLMTFRKVQLSTIMIFPVAGICSRCIRTRCSPPSLNSPRLSPSLLFRRASSRSSHHTRKPSLTALLSRNDQTKPIRRFIQTQRYQAFAPPTPESLGKAAPPKHYRRTIRWGRRLLYVSVAAGIFYLFDKYILYSSLGRSLRTFYNSLVIAVDYKLNFRPKPLFGGDINDIHKRSAERMFNLLHQNGGLYLKIGQAIAMQSAVLPPEFQKMFARMFDDAPQNDWSDVEAVIREDFGGRSPEEVFGVSFSNEPGFGMMEKRARASASVAQVHWAALADGREIAIKVQKREIAFSSRLGSLVFQVKCPLDM